MSIQRIGGRDVVILDRLASPSQEDVQLFVRKLHAGILSYGLYPPGHTIIVKRTKDLHEHLNKLFLECSMLVIQCEQSLSLNKVRVLRNVPERELSMKTASYLGLRGVKNLVLWPRVKHEELGELLQTWHSINEEEEEEAYDWLHRFRSDSARMNMDMIDSLELESAKGGSPSISLSKKELADILTNIGPDGGGQGAKVESVVGSLSPNGPSDVRIASGGNTATVRIINEQAPPQDSYGGRSGDSYPGQQGGRRSNNYARPVNSSSSTGSSSASANPDGSVGQAQHVLQHVGGQVVNAQNVIQQYSGAVGQPGRGREDFSGMVYPPNGPGAPHDTSPNANPADIFGNSLHVESSPEWSAAQSNGLPPSSTDNQMPPYFGGGGEDANSALPPGLREPAAMHPSRQQAHAYAGAPSSSEQPWDPGQSGFGQRPELPEMDGPTVSESYPYSSGNATPPSGQNVPGFGPGDSHSGSLGERQFRITEVTPSVADLPSIQGQIVDAGQTPLPIIVGEQPASQGHLASPYSPLTPLPPVGSPLLPGSGESPIPTSPLLHDSETNSMLRSLQEEGTVVDRNPLLSGPPSSPSYPASSPSHGALGPASHHHLPTPEWVTADPVSLDQSSLDIGQLDFGRIEPHSLLRSQRVQEYLSGGGIPLFLSRFLSATMCGQDPTSNGQVVMVQGEGGWLGMGGGKALMSAVDELPNSELQKQMVKALAETISSTIPELIDEQLAHLGQTQSEQLLREEVVRQVPSAWRHVLSELITERLWQARKPRQFDGCMRSLSLLTEGKLDEGGWRLLIPVLEQLNQRLDDASNSEGLQKQIVQWRESLSSPSVGRVFFQALLHSHSEEEREEARRGILAMGASSAYNLTLFLGLSSDPRRNQLLLDLVKDVGEQLDEVDQTFFLDQIWESGATLEPGQQSNLCRYMYSLRPDFVEKHLVDLADRLDHGGPGVTFDDWVRWARLSLECHTPRLRELLGRRLQDRHFYEYPDVEAGILKLLDGHGTLQGFEFLERTIQSPHVSDEHKASAVYLLGSLRTEQSLLLLRGILLERKRFLRQPVYGVSLRSRALAALEQFPSRQVQELVKKVCQDPDPTVREQAQNMLDVLGQRA
ncbi:MAG: hypothetical protein EP343_07840 [Deltaproteobacteria bacterium]|nr:MAG: hypothetical protein EP343_07840 [Deltaproteobacteria bacterium]